MRPPGIDVADFKLKAFFFSLVDAAMIGSSRYRPGVFVHGAKCKRSSSTSTTPPVEPFKCGGNSKKLSKGRTNRCTTTSKNLIDSSEVVATSDCPKKLVVEYLLDGFRPLDKMLLDASAGGTMMSLPLSGIRELVTKVAENARFREETTRQEEFSRTKSVAKAESPAQPIAEQLKEMREMKEMMATLIRRQPVVVEAMRVLWRIGPQDRCVPDIVRRGPGRSQCDRRAPSLQQSLRAKSGLWTRTAGPGLAEQCAKGRAPAVPSCAARRTPGEPRLLSPAASAVPAERARPIPARTEPRPGWSE
ncbi:unnamed protein product [Rhodiola kirilowii]